MNKDIYLTDYTQPHFWAEFINLDIDINGDHTYVTAKTRYIPNTNNPGTELLLNGVELELLEIKLDGKKLDHDFYSKDEFSLNILKLDGPFVLETTVKINPDTNFTGEGLYKSGSIYCTQCEAEGFRRITYYQDRPDVMASFKTTIRADKKLYPQLLSNGNPVETGDLENNRHFATWEDPHKKPAYLFAAVAGDLSVIKDQYITTSGRNVKLEIYVDPGNEDKCEHAMQSLINSMKWDEDVYGLEYDLDIYMIVAVDSFNMGAMENKGLNIFNSAYVLAKKETATDTDFQGIEGVIGHEYFHNWTGNRVTCRDWFQLTLKEGLTVFRDQEFSADMLSRPVKRIVDVRRLKLSQFQEDSSPFSHPIKPKAYSEINNFYTATIYEKGAEVIRMIHTLIGKDNFRKGMDLYFKRHDGEAVTTEDFASAMSDVSGVSLEHFKVWYDQNGTPELNIHSDYDAKTKELTIEVSQFTKTNNAKFDCLYMPFHMAIFLSNGNKVEISDDGRYIIDELKKTFKFSNIPSEPILSLNRGFAAPVIINHKLFAKDLNVLMSFESDSFNQYDSAQKIYEIEINGLMSIMKKGETPELTSDFKEAFSRVLDNEKLDNAFKALVLTSPSLSELINKLAVYDFDHLPQAIHRFKQLVASNFESQLFSLYKSCLDKGDFSISTAAMGKRDLKSVVLNYLLYTESDKSYLTLYNEFKTAGNMTDEFSALSKLTLFNNKYRDEVLSSFYNKWKDETLVMQKWMSANALASDASPSKLLAIAGLDIFDSKVPNHIRSLYSQFAVGNLVQMNAIDGSGYKFYTDCILELDKVNPQIAAGLARRLNYLDRLDSTRGKLLKAQMDRILSTKGLSTDVNEIVTKNLSL